MLFGRFLTVRRGLTFIILLLAGLIQALMLVVLISSLDKRDAGRELTRSNEVAGLLSTAARHWARERSRTAIALSAAAPAEPTVLQALAEARRLGEEALEGARQRLARTPELHLKALLLPEVEAALVELEPLRRAVDGALALAGPQRDTGLSARGPAGLTAAIERTRALVQRLLAIGEELEPAASLVRLQGALWTVEQLAWHAQAIRGSAGAAGQGLDPATLTQLGQVRGRQEEAWQSARSIASRLPGETLAAAIEAASAAYFGPDGVALGPDPSPWAPTNLTALDSLGAAHMAAAEMTAQAAAELTEVSEGAITLGYILLGGAMIGSALALAIIHFGLYRPLSRLVEAAGRLAQIEGRDSATVEIPSHGRHDELGALARTLGALQSRLGYQPAR